MPVRHAAKNQDPDIPASIYAVEEAVSLETNVGRNWRTGILSILRIVRILPAMFFGELDEVAMGKGAGKET